jgi:hypothetical protein
MLNLRTQAMPLYYLHLRSRDGFVRDIEGSDLPDLEAAKSEARDGIRGLVADALFAGTEIRLQSVEITNGSENLGQVTMAEVVSGIIPIDDTFDADLKNYLDTRSTAP